MRALRLKSAAWACALYGTCFVPNSDRTYNHTPDSTIWAQPPVMKHNSIPRLEWPLVVPWRLRPEPPPPARRRPVAAQPPVPVPLTRPAPPSPRLQALPVCAPATARAAAAVSLPPRRFRPIPLLVAVRSSHGRQALSRPRPRRLLPHPQANQRDGSALLVAVVAVR